MKHFRFFIFLASSLGLAGCGVGDLGDQLMAQGEGPASALGQEWKRADALVEDGEEGLSLTAKGQVIVNKKIESVNA